MHQKLSVTVQVDLDDPSVRLVVTGCLTAASRRALHRSIRRARNLAPGIRLTIDLSRSHHLDATGVEQLRRAVDHDIPTAGRGPVELIVPGPLPHHREAARIQDLLVS